MLIYPAIDLMDGQAVRLLKGDYGNKTVYSEDPLSVAAAFKECGAGQMHIVDLDGAKTGGTPNIETILAIKKSCGLFCQAGGGIRNMKTVESYLEKGIDRVILGTAAVTEEGFAKEAAGRFGDRIYCRNCIMSGDSVSDTQLISSRKRMPCFTPVVSIRSYTDAIISLIVYSVTSHSSPPYTLRLINGNPIALWRV